MACCSTIYQRPTLQPTINFFLDCILLPSGAQVSCIMPASPLCKKKRNIKISRIIYSVKHRSVLPLDKKGNKGQKTGLKDAMRQMFDGIREYMVCGVLSSFQQNKLEQQSKQKTCFALYYLVS